MASVLQSPAELKAVIEAERAGTPFVVFRDAGETQQLRVLDPGRERLTVGRSRKGTYLNGERSAGRRRLCDGDVVRFGKTVATFREPADTKSAETEVAADAFDPASLSDAQRRVLVALCRPFRDASGYVTPATNQQVADELFLSVDAVKTHLRTLFGKFGIEDLPQNQKRVRLVEMALKSGAVSLREL